MENVVEDVEDQSESEGSPAHSQRYEDLTLCKLVGFSVSVSHSDVLLNCGHGHTDGDKCQAGGDIL